MPAIGHMAVGMAAARVYTPRTAPTRRLIITMMVLAIVAWLPDADVIAFSLGIPYQAPWGHRGAAHSLGFALIVGLAAIGVATILRLPVIRTGAVVTVVVATHGVLDIFTNGGLGIALFWPISNQRFFAPWQPLPVAPIGWGMLSRWGLKIILYEALVFSPLFAIALWPRRSSS